MIKVAMVAAALLALVSAAAGAAATAETGRELVRQCENARPNLQARGDAVEAARCLAYLIGVFDGLRIVSAGLRDPLFCPPSGLGDDDFAEIFLAWARNNPRLLDRYPAPGVAEAFVRGFACPR